MTTLDDAWRWYCAVADGMKRLTHLAKYWGRFPWGQADEWVGLVERDNVLRHVEAVPLADDARLVTDEQDDLAILVLFSVFEANVRDHLKKQLLPAIGRLEHPTLARAGNDVLEDIEHGSFGRLLEPFKLEDKDKDLVEQVNQIRRYRNWVAHGRRDEMYPDVIVRPLNAYERLTEFLKLVRNFDPPTPRVGEASEA
jgi:hypothetical protein